MKTSAASAAAAALPASAAASSSSTVLPPSSPAVIILPKTGVARVKSVLSGDTVVLLGKQNSKNNHHRPPPPEVLFTLEAISAPRMASTKNNQVDEPGAFPSREYLRRLLIGRNVHFETRKQGTSAGDTTRVYGCLYFPNENNSNTNTNNGSNGGNHGESNGSNTMINIGVEAVRQGWASPKAALIHNSMTHATANATNTAAAAAAATGGDKNKDDSSPVITEKDAYETALLAAYQEAKTHRRGIHSTADATTASPLLVVRNIQQAGEDFSTTKLVDAVQKKCTNGQVQCVIEHIFDGGRVKCQIVDEMQPLPEFRFAHFTLLLAGIACPRLGNSKADPPTLAEPFAEEARHFVSARILQRELLISLLGVEPKSGVLAVGTIHHPMGNIAIELLNHGLARMTDWSVRLMPPGHVAALRVAEQHGQRTRTRIWQTYVPPEQRLVHNARNVSGVVVEVLSGDTLAVLPDGKDYTTDADLIKVSLSSLRAPRPGSDRMGRPDEPYSMESKDLLRLMTIGKTVHITVHYERDIPLQPGVNESRPFGTVKCGKHEDVSEVLVLEGLALTQRHRDDDEKSPRYDELRAAEALAKANKKGVHKESSEYKANVVNDLTDPRKAKAYSGSLMRAGKLKGLVEFVFHGALFKILIPSENCHIRFAPNYLRCPQPSPSPGSKQQNRAAEPYGDAAKYHARLRVLQRPVELVCTSVTNSGIIVGSMCLGFGAKQVDYSIELLGAGLATLDPRKVEYGEVPKHLLDAQAAAEANRIGIWSVERPDSITSVAAANNNHSTERFQDKIMTVRLSEVRSGSHFFFRVVGDNNDAAANNNNKLVDESMRRFTQTHGTAGGGMSITDAKVGKIVAALFDDGSGKGWYRAKIVEKKGPAGKVQVLFIDHGNLATLTIATHLRPLDLSLGPDRIPAVAKEAALAFVHTRPLSTEEGVDAARFLQSACWGKDLSAHTFAPDASGKLAVSLSTTTATATTGSENNNNAGVQMIEEGLARVIAKSSELDCVTSQLKNTDAAMNLIAELNVAQESARKSRAGMWRYGDIGDDDPDAI